MSTAKTIPAVTATITRRTRSFGIGWTNETEQTANGLRVKRPTSPDVVGTVRDVAAEMDRARRVNSGNDWRRVFFLGGRPVVEAHGLSMEDAVELLAQGVDSAVEVRFVDG